MGTETVWAQATDEVTERRREQRGWYFYDWACSVYSTSVLTVFLGPYLTAVAKHAADADGFVHPLGIPVRSQAPSSPMRSRRPSFCRSS